MIMIRDDAVSKRPRTQSVQSFEKRDDYEDDVTEASIQDSEDPCSPRGISVILKDALDTRLKAIKRKEAHAVSASLSASVSLAKARKPSLSDKQITPVLSESDHGDVCRKRRAEAMERFRRKKAVRCFGRRVRYQIRKRIATTRPRVNGRFAKRCDAERHMQAKMMKSE